MRELGDIVRLFERSPGETLALATLVRARGSSYRRPGARMLIASGGETAGSLSGGCLEEEIVERAFAVLKVGEPELFEVDTRLRLGCHGAIQILIERAQPNFLADLAVHLRKRQIFRVATVFDPAAGELGTRFDETTEFSPEHVLVQKILPPIQLVIIGRGPDHAALRAFAQTLGWTVVEVESATELESPLDERTAAIVKTHNFGRDFAALRTLAAHPLGYVGLLGPRKRREQLIGDLLDTGFDAPANFFAPAGLDLGGDAPEEIALSIIAEIQAVFAEGSRQSLRDWRRPIHARRARPTLA